MSGPWDRPPSPDDGDWPSEDIETRSSADRPVEPWSADDPWQERRDASPGWDEWPQPAPSTDDFVTEEPEPPASDPWAESWSEDEPGIPASPEPAVGPPPTEPFFEPEVDPVAEPVAESAVGPVAEPAVEPVAEPVSEPVAEPEPAFDAPRVQPWSPDPDPWGAASVDAWSPSYEDAAEPTDAMVEEEGPEHEAPASGSLPEWREPEPEAAVVADEPEPEPEPELVAQEPEPEPASVTAELEPEPEPEPEPELEPAFVAPEREPEPELEPEIPPFLAVPEPEPEPAFVESEAEPELEPEPAAVDSEEEPEPEIPPFLAVPEPEPEPEPAFERPSWMPLETPPELRPTALAEPDLAEPEPEPAAADAFRFEPDMNGVEDGAGAASPWEPDLWTTPIERAAYEPIPEPIPEAEPEPEHEPELQPEPLAPDAGSAAAPWPMWDQDIETETLPEPEPEPEREPERTTEPAWPELGESTQVLPTSWTPHTPGEAGGELEPHTGDVRTTLGARDSEAEAEDEDAEANASTAEQAVPWLIGVILLLAGMVIVLIALIFAGDASLGGLGVDPSDSPQASPSVEPTPVATANPNASPSATPGGSGAPSPTAATEPQYGPLEMIYQGRAQALEPIFLLHRDFAVDQEPTVLARDPTLDFNRFAWAPDGRVGAGLYSDFLLLIETDRKREGGDGMSAITFGDDASTVYAVRITADGGNDVATILSIDFASKALSELATITYARPQIAEEAALVEAQFADDGGTVRLYWLKNNRLCLWVLGSGAWSIGPSDGEVTEIEGGEVPLLWSPDGRSRVGLAMNGSSTTLRLVDRSGEELASADVTGRVSHLRWSPDGKRVVFTVGRAGSGGGVLQDLYLWDLGVGENPDPVRITDTGKAFGAEWRGSQALWEAR